ncbi:hypothetical protein [Metabacillus sp. RGM 3146]|uniref:UPF0738 family protein n=1 Tax=Metabacillus sp. RGM 3146 TaxID=3401092 RepID=UPI003B99EC43
MKKILVTEAKIKDGKVIFHTQAYEGNASELTPKGQILADSDQLSLVYILENTEDFIYLSMPHSVWDTLHEARKQEVDAAAVINGTEITLPHFYEELNALLVNIKDNANYGEDMERQVSESFAL